MEHEGGADRVSTSLARSRGRGQDSNLGGGLPPSRGLLHLEWKARAQSGSETPEASVAVLCHPRSHGTERCSRPALQSPVFAHRRTRRHVLRQRTPRGGENKRS